MMRQQRQERPMIKTMQIQRVHAVLLLRPTTTLQEPSPARHESRQPHQHKSRPQLPAHTRALKAVADAAAASATPQLSQARALPPRLHPYPPPRRSAAAVAAATAHTRTTNQPGGSARQARKGCSAPAPSCQASGTTPRAQASRIRPHSHSTARAPSACAIAHPGANNGTPGGSSGGAAFPSRPSSPRFSVSCTRPEGPVCCDVCRACRSHRSRS